MQKKKDSRIKTKLIYISENGPEWAGSVKFGSGRSSTVDFMKKLLKTKTVANAAPAVPRGVGR